MFRQLGAPELVLILGVLVLLFGANKLPDLARGSGRALRIFKAETKGLIGDDDQLSPAEPGELEPSKQHGQAAPTAEPAA